MSTDLLAGFVAQRVARAAGKAERVRRPPLGVARLLMRHAGPVLGTPGRTEAMDARLELAPLLGAVGSLGTAATVLHSAGAPLALLHRHASSMLRARVLDGALAGAHSVAVAYPRAGEAPCILRPSTGPLLAVDGRVACVAGVPGADWLVVPVQVEGGAGIDGLVVVRASSPHVLVDRVHTVGLHAAALGDVTLQDCPVARWQVLGSAAARSLPAVTADERLLMASAMVAAMEGALTRTLVFVGGRLFAPGQVLGDQQVVRHRLADLMADHDVTDAYVREVAAERVHGPVAPHRAAGVALVACAALRRVAEGCMQLLGARGFMDEHPVTRTYRDAVTLPLLPLLDPDTLARDAAQALFGSAPPVAARRRTPDAHELGAMAGSVALGAALEASAVMHAADSDAGDGAGAMDAAAGFGRVERELAFAGDIAWRAP